MSAPLGKPTRDLPSGISGHRLARVDLHGQWHILVVTNMADDETGEPGVLSYDPAAAERVRQLLSGRSDVVEKKMVGGLSFLVNGNMCCGITGMALMVRVGAESREQVLREPHVRPMLFAGRALSGFVCIEPEGYATDGALASWVQRGLEFVSGLPTKSARAS
jgi:TfoX/Sxy family transcriptional regulator of competence genes